MNEEMDIQSSEVVDDGLPIQGDEVSLPLSEVTVSVPAENVIPVYSSVEDGSDFPIAYDILLEENEEEQQETVETTEYSDNEVLIQINENLVDSLTVQSGLVGMLIGLIVGLEVLKIWLT